jgi:serine phosphatase RsbU (regulator of sigma subunit)
MLEQRHSMITAFFGIYNTHTREFVYTVAGHPRPIMVHGAGELATFECTGPPLGEAFDEVLLDQRTLNVPAESAIVFFTDGLIEYSRDVLHAEERLRGAMRERTFLQGENPAQAIIDAVLEGRQSDDIAVLVMRAF